MPAFSGLLAPYWRQDARGVILGLSLYSTRDHICRAMLEAICFQSVELLSAMQTDAEHPLTVLQVDGGVTNSDICMQIQADLAGCLVKRPEMRENTALGAAACAGVGSGLWTDIADAFKGKQENVKVFKSCITEQERLVRIAKWKSAVEKSFL